MPGDARPIPLAELRARMEPLYRPPMRSPATWVGIRRALDLLEQLGGVETTADLTTQTIARFIANRPATESPNTTYSLVNRLSTICNYAAAEGLVRVSPFAVRRRWVRRIPPSPDRQRHHTREEIARVLDLLRREAEQRTRWARWRARRLYALAATYAYTGIRKTEGLMLTVDDLNFDDRMILIWPRRGHALKTEAAAQPVPMADPLVPILKDWLTHRLDWPGIAEDVPRGVTPFPAANLDCPYLFPNVRRTNAWLGGTQDQRPCARIKAAGQRAGVDGLKIASFRHSWASHAEFWGLTDVQIQRILRHTNTRTQLNYRHADEANLREIARRINFDPATG